MNEEILRKLAQHVCDAYVGLKTDDPRFLFFSHDDNPDIGAGERVVVIVRREHVTRNSLEPYVTFAGAVKV